ncbi:MAG: peptidylprolyl isomerase [Anaerolineales bacterium]
MSKKRSKQAQERRLRRILIVGTVAVLVLAVLILAWGLYDQYVLQPKKPVATVSDVPIPLETYQNLVRYRRWDYQNYLNQLENQKLQVSGSDEETQEFYTQYLDQQMEQIQEEMANLPTSVLNEMIDYELARQECEQRDITVSSEEVERRLESQFGYNPDPPTPAPTPITSTENITPTPTVEPMTYEEYVEQSENWFETTAEQTGFTKNDFLDLLEKSLYYEKLAEAIGDEVPTTTEQIRARHILVETEEEAEEALARLEAGEEFATVAAEVSQDESNKDQGGDLGWFARGGMVPEFEEVAFDMEPGEISDVVETSFGFHIIKVEERDENRELSESELQQMQQQAAQEWFAERRESEDVQIHWDSSMVPEMRPTQPYQP